jgi:hypothetical protein
MLPSLVSGAYPLPGPDPRCNKCPDGVCVPNRFTYGYYAPKWRRWPGSGLGPETIPTPTGKSLQQTDADPAEEEPTNKGADERPQTEPRTQREQTSPDSSTNPDIPAADVPGTIAPGTQSGQQDLPTPTIDEDLRNILEDDGPQTPPTDTPLLPDTDSSPMPDDAPIQGISPEDDPFKDDAQSLRHRSTHGKRASATEPPVSTVASRRKAPKVHWRTDPQSDAATAVEIHETTHTDRAIKPASAIELQTDADDAGNPLRPHGHSTVDHGVKRSVNWAGDSQLNTASSAVWRTNPLR